MCKAKAHEFLFSAASERDCVRELHCLAPDGRPALSLVVSEGKSKVNSMNSGGTGSSLVPTIYGACGTICNDVHCPNAVGGSRHIHRNHVKCLPACHGRRTRMLRSVPLRVRSLHLHWQAVQPRLVSRSESGGRPPPHQCYQILSRGRPWLSGGTC